MKIERLRNKKSKLIFLCGCLMVVVLLIAVVIQGSRAKYRSSQIIPLITNKSITNKVPSFTTMGIYLEDSTGTEVKNGKKYKKQETIPSEGFIINETNSYCEKFNSATNTNEKNANAKLYTNILGKHSMEGINKGDKCYIYFDKGSNQYISAKQFLLGMWGYEDVSKITERTDFDTVRTDGGNKLYKADDDYGTSYYFVGNPQNNWVKFGGYYWRIVRINGNGSLRLIYQGTTANTSGAGTNLKNSYYNRSNNSGYYVGFMYSEGTRVGFGTSSNIKNELDTFFINNLASYDNYIDKNTGFCNDRSVTEGNGYDDKLSHFGGFTRLYENKTPILACPDTTNDLFTVATADNGNKKLIYPIGLITGDEVLMGGLVYGTSPSSRKVNMYDTGEDYWTGTPSHFYDFYPHLFNVDMSGKVFLNSSYNDLGVRPVINLVKNIAFSKGNGSISNPFEI